MIVERIANRSELEETCRWYVARGARPPELDWFGHGFWIRGVAAVFPVFTDTPRAYVEDVVTNPEASSEARATALETLEAFVLQEAKARGYLFVVGWSREPDIAKRASARGFVDLGAFQGFAKRLE